MVDSTPAPDPAASTETAAPAADPAPATAAPAADPASAAEPGQVAALPPPNVTLIGEQYRSLDDDALIRR